MWGHVWKKFISEMYLKISGKKQKTTVLILTAILGAVTVFCLITKADKITILYNLLYYTVFIAMEEELLVRGICVYLLKDENNYIRYLVPNILFAAMHLFSYTNWGFISSIQTSCTLSIQYLRNTFLWLLQIKNRSLYKGVLLTYKHPEHQGVQLFMLCSCNVLYFLSPWYLTYLFPISPYCTITAVQFSRFLQTFSI